MATETILQSDIAVRFVLPFLLIFFILYGILEKTKAFGEGNKQLNAFIAFVVGLIFVGAASPKLVVSNLILFFTVAIVVLFIALLLWGFVSGEEAKLPDSKALKIIAGIVIVVAVVIALLSILDLWNPWWDTIKNTLFDQSWSGEFWTNVLFILVVIGALVAVLVSGKKES